MEKHNVVGLLPKEAFENFKNGNVYLGSDIRIVAIIWDQKDVNNFMNDLENSSWFYRKSPKTIIIDEDKLRKMIKNAKGFERYYMALFYFSLVAGAYGGYRVRIWEIETKSGMKYYFVVGWTNEYEKNKNEKEIFEISLHEFKKLIKNLGEEDGND